MRLDAHCGSFIGTCLHLERILVTSLPHVIRCCNEELAIPSVCRIINGMNSHTTGVIHTDAIFNTGYVSAAITVTADVSGTVRASFALYNTKEEIDALVAGIRRVSMMRSEEAHV